MTVPGPGALFSLEGASLGPPGGTAVLTGVGLSLGRGEVGVLLGGNGAGKSTLLRSAAGLWPPLAGRIAPERDGFDPREVGFVLEDPSSQLVAGTVAGEIEFVLEGLALPAPEIRARRDRILAGFGLEGVAARDPRSLSPGEQQRCALAAAWAPEPSLLLLDDPFLYLGPAASGALWERVLLSVRDGTIGGALLATHDGERAVDADRVGVLAGGRLAAWGPPDEVLCGELPGAVDIPLGAWLERALAAQGRPLAGTGYDASRMASRLVAQEER